MNMQKNLVKAVALYSIGGQPQIISTGPPHSPTTVNVVVVLLFYIHGKHLRSCQDSQLT